MKAKFGPAPYQAVCGGCCVYIAQVACVTFRYGHDPSHWISYVGLRLVRRAS